MTGSYNVQDCDVSSDQHTSSILVECTFAINSTAPGIVVIQDDQSQYTINKTLQRLLQDGNKGSVNITGLPAGEYSVRVYDNSPATNSTSAAYQHSQLIHIMELPKPSSTCIVLHSVVSSGAITLSCLSIIVYCLYSIYRHIQSWDEFTCVYHTTQQCQSYHDCLFNMYACYYLVIHIVLHMYTVNSTTSIIIAATGLLLLVLDAAVITGILCTAVAMRQKQHTTGNSDYCRL